MNKDGLPDSQQLAAKVGQVGQVVGDLSKAQESEEEHGAGTRRQHPSNSPSILAGVTRALLAPLVFYFRSPIRLFRPPRLSSWTVIHALAESEGKRLDWRYMRKIIQRERWWFLPHHMFPPMMANAAVSTTLFTVYTQVEFSLRQHYGYTHGESSFLAGGTAGLCQTVIACPLELLKARFQASDLLQGKYRGIGDYVYQTAVRDARQFARDAFRGWWITAVRDSLGFSLFFGGFTWARRESLAALRTLLQPRQDGAARVGATVMGGLVAAFAYQFVMFPMDRLHSLLRGQQVHPPLQHHGRHSQKARKPRQWLREMYTGIGRNYTRSLLPTAAALCCFEFMMRMTMVKEEETEG